MKHSKSFYSLIIAISIHALIIGVLWFSNHEFKDKSSLNKELRFGIHLSEIVEEESELPIPSGKLDRYPQPKQKSTHQAQTTRTNSSPQSKSSTVEAKPFTPEDRENLPFSVLHHYGEEFFNLTAGEQNYIIDNLQRIRKLNEIVGTRLLRERYHDDVDPLDNNVVEFMLHPDGSISDLTLEKNRIGSALDELTLQTIDLAHPKYPKPQQPIKIRIRVYILIK